MSEGDRESDAERYWYRFSERVRLVLFLLAAGVTLVLLVIAVGIYTDIPWLMGLFPSGEP